MPSTARKHEPSHGLTEEALRCGRCGRLTPRGEPHACGSAPELDGAATRPEPGPLPEPAAPPDPLIGAVLGGRYQIIERLSSGGMGIVYKARHIVLKSLVAVKVLLEQLVPSEPRVEPLGPSAAGEPLGNGIQGRRTAWSQSPLD